MLDFFKFWLRNDSISILGVRNTIAYRRAMKEYASLHPNCAFCGRSKDVDVHHKVPVSYAPELAADQSNMITLCRKPQCHLVVGHLGNFKNYNERVAEVCDMMNNDINSPS